MREIERRIDRKLQTSNGQHTVDVISEFACDSIGDALDNVPRGVNSPDSLMPDWREMRRSPLGIFRNFGPTHWLGEYVQRPQDYFNMIRTGAPRMREHMLAMMEQIHLPDAALRPELTQRRRRTRGDFGNEVDIHKVYQGRSDVAWTKITTDKVMTHGNRLVHLVIDNGAPMLTPADDSMWLGAAVMRIYEALTRMGCSVAISVYGGAYNLWHGHKHRHGMISILVKDYGAPLREEQLAIVSHLACFRALMLPVLSIYGREREINMGMGYSVSDYQLRVESAEEDELRGGNVITVGKAFNRGQAERLVHDFVETHVFGEIAEGKSTRQLYGFEAAEDEEKEEEDAFP